MSSPTKSDDRARWWKRPEPDQQPQDGYEHWLADEIEAGLAELDRGEGLPAEKAWKALGLE
ncbi:MAG TPA: hypothetical protein VMM55_12785 [Thermohalobaculum sp.]|nr:hypothetical protein [Thermohalobaculum sp.]